MRVQQRTFRMPGKLCHGNSEHELGEKHALKINNPYWPHIMGCAEWFVHTYLMTAVAASKTLL
jgi:hypothetical protein